MEAGESVDARISEDASVFAYADGSAPSDVSADGLASCSFDTDDASACKCVVDQYELKTSLDCLCQLHGCPCTLSEAIAIGRSACAGPLPEIALLTVAGPPCGTTSVFLSNGYGARGWGYDSRTEELVSTAELVDYTPFQCPFDASIIVDGSGIFATISSFEPHDNCAIQTCRLCDAPDVRDDAYPPCP
jgi:hypothetical protein